MRLTKTQLKRIIREEYSSLKRRGLIKESMKDLLGEIQNEILMVGQDFGGELTVQDAVEHLASAFEGPSGAYASGMSYDEVLDIMWGMVDAGMLTDGYEDFFSVHPDYM